MTAEHMTDEEREAPKAALALLRDHPEFWNIPFDHLPEEAQLRLMVAVAEDEILFGDSKTLNAARLHLMSQDRFAALPKEMQERTVRITYETHGESGNRHERRKAAKIGRRGQVWP